jgi:hypothetical protein
MRRCASGCELPLSRRRTKAKASPSEILGISPRSSLATSSEGGLPRTHLPGARERLFRGAAPTETRTHRSDGQRQRVHLRHLLYPATRRSNVLRAPSPRDMVVPNEQTVNVSGAGPVELSRPLLKPGLAGGDCFGGGERPTVGRTGGWHMRPSTESTRCRSRSNLINFDQAIEPGWSGRPYRLRIDLR